MPDGAKRRWGHGAVVARANYAEAIVNLRRGRFEWSSALRVRSPDFIFSAER